MIIIGHDGWWVMSIDGEITPIVLMIYDVWIS